MGATGVELDPIPLLTSPLKGEELFLVARSQSHIS
jgi:hypothetical protein